MAADGFRGAETSVNNISEKELVRTERMYFFENKYAPDYHVICGLDEVGRGPLAGPVVAWAVVLPHPKQVYFLNDSKKLSVKKRECLSEIIKEEAVCYSYGVVGEDTIDEKNILFATYAAMREALARLSLMPDLLLNDAVRIPGVDIKQVPIVGGDGLCASIAAASIVAKVIRDALMCEYDLTYPEYGFAKHKGYGTKEHIEAIKRHGLCPIHRKSFTKKFVMQSENSER